MYCLHCENNFLNSINYFFLMFAQNQHIIKIIHTNQQKN